VPSPENDSLLLSLLTLAKIPSDKISLYSLPSAWSDISITKADYSDTGVHLVLDHLTLELQYDFNTKASGQVELRVLTPTQGFTPYVTASSDINGRGDGMGEFERTYTENGRVTLSAPAKYGQWNFKKWTDAYGNDAFGSPATNVTLSITMDNNKTVRPQYINQDPNDTDGDTIPDWWEMQYFGSLSEADATTDHDGDGLSDAEEYWYGTNPLQADTDGDGIGDLQAALIGITHGKGSVQLKLCFGWGVYGKEAVISWNSLPGRIYRVYVATALNGPWGEIYTVLGNGGSLSCSNYVWDSENSKYFKLTAVVDGTALAPPKSFNVLEGSTLAVAAPGVVIDHPGADDLITAVLLTPPTVGDLQLNPDGSFVYSPWWSSLTNTLWWQDTVSRVNTACGDSFTFEARSTLFQSGPTTAHLSLWPSRYGPVARDDCYTNVLYSTLEIPAPGVIANDTMGASPAGFFSAELITADGLSWAEGEHGMIGLNSDGSFWYDSWSVGVDMFTYRVINDLFESEPATIRVITEP
jgi:Bacterial TSP3 repeat